jgi:hypothetical protein
VETHVPKSTLQRNPMQQLQTTFLRLSTQAQHQQETTPAKHNRHNYVNFLQCPLSKLGTCIIFVPNS